MELKKTAYAEHRIYMKSKEQLLGIIKSMTEKPLDEKKVKVNAIFQSQSVSIAERLASFSANHRADEISRFVEMKTVNLSCPLQLWKNIVFPTTTNKAGNIRADQYAAIRILSGMRQRNNESLPDYQQRFTNTKETYILLDIPLPSESIMVTTFIRGLDTSKYSDFLTYLHNELSIGRDLFPTDLVSVILKASK